MAGFDVNSILAGLPDVLNLALAGDLDLGAAADIASNISTPFGIAAKDISRVTDLLATAATSSNTNVEQMAGAFKYVAAGAAAAGQSIEEVSASLAILANNGIQSEMAGTAVRQVLIELADQGKRTKLKEAFNIDVTDADGKIRPVLSIMRDLNDATAELSSADQLATFFDLFGARAGNAALVLSKAGDEVGVFREKMVGASGAAKTMAQTMADNLGGDFKGFMSAVEGTQIAVGEAFNTMSRDAVQWATGATRSVAGFISENQKLVQFLGKATAAVAAFGAINLSAGLGAKLFSGIASAAAGIESAAKKANIFGAAMDAVKSRSESLGPVLSASLRGADAELARLSSAMTGLGAPIQRISAAMAGIHATRASAEVGALITQLGAGNTAATRWAANVLLMGNASAAAAVKTGALSAVQNVWNVRAWGSAAASKMMASGDAFAAATKTLLARQTWVAVGAATKNAAVQLAVATRTAFAAAANGILAISLKGVAGATLLASISFKALAAAIYAIPGWGWALAGIAAITALATKLVTASEYTAKLSDEMAQKRESGDETRNVDELRMARLKQLAGMENLDNQQKKEASELVGKLSGVYGDFGAEIDNVTGKVTLAGDAMERLNAAMAAKASRELEAELAEVQKNLGELQKEADSVSVYWRQVGSNITFGLGVDTASEKQEKIGEKQVEQLKKAHEIRQKIARLEGGEKSTDVAKDDTTLLQERLAEGGGEGVQKIADSAKRLGEIQKTISRERATQLENEISDVRALSTEYRGLLETLIASREGKKGLTDAETAELADWKKQLSDTAAVEAERINRAIDKAQKITPTDAAMLEKRLAAGSSQQAVTNARAAGMPPDQIAALEAALRDANVQLDAAELDSAGKSLAESSDELRSAIRTWQETLRSGTAETQAIAAQAVYDAEQKQGAAKSRYDTASGRGAPLESDAALAARQAYGAAVAGGNAAAIGAAKMAVEQVRKTEAETTLATAGREFAAAMQDLANARAFGNLVAANAAGLRVGEAGGRLDEAAQMLQTIRDGMKTAANVASVGNAGSRGTFSAWEAAFGGRDDWQRQASDRIQRLLEKVVGNTENDGDYL